MAKVPKVVTGAWVGGFPRPKAHKVPWCPRDGCGQSAGGGWVLHYESRCEACSELTWSSEKLCPGCGRCKSCGRVGKKLYQADKLLLREGS